MKGILTPILEEEDSPSLSTSEESCIAFESKMRVAQSKPIQKKITELTQKITALRDEIKSTLERETPSWDKPFSIQPLATRLGWECLCL